MKIDYRREIKHNYLIIDPEELFWQGYESQMLSRNQIEGILRFQIRQTDEGARFYYEITSRQPLSRILGNRNIQAEEIRRLVIGIFSVLERMEPYLLGEGNILLNPEYLYVEPDSFRVWLCLIPGLRKNFPEDFSKLLEYLLGCVDHQDRDSVVLAYGLYQETRKENYGLADIMRLLRQEKTDKETGYSETEKPGYEEGNEFVRNSSRVWDGKKEGRGNNKENNGEGRREKRGGKMQDTENNRKEKRKIGGATDTEDRNEKNNRNRKAFWQKQNDYEEHNEEKGWKSHWNQWKKRFFSKNEPEEDLPVRPPWEMMFQEEDEEISQSSFVSQRLNPQASHITPPSQTTSRGTILLADFSENSGQRMLRALDIDGEDIPIPYYPFIIGKQENLVDFKLNRDTVSRLHLRIDQEDGGYRIKDLNSTNGTMLCGRLLENNEEAELHTGDEIRIAKYRYRFE